MHVDLRMQLNVKKDIIGHHVEGQTSGECKPQREGCKNSGHVNHMSKCLILVMTMHLLKVMSRKMSLV